MAAGQTSDNRITRLARRGSVVVISLQVTSAVTHKVEPVAFDSGSRLAPFRAKKPLQVPGDAVPQWERKVPAPCSEEGRAWLGGNVVIAPWRLSSKQPPFAVPPETLF